MDQSPTPLRGARRGGGSPLSAAIARTVSKGSDGSGARKRLTLDAPDIHAFANHLLSKTLDEVLPGRIDGDGDDVHTVSELKHLFADRTHVQRTRARLRTTHAAGRTICLAPAGPWRQPAHGAHKPAAQVQVQTHHAAKPHLGDLAEHMCGNTYENTFLLRRQGASRKLSTMRERVTQRLLEENSTSSQASHIDLFKYVSLHACSLTYHASEQSCRVHDDDVFYLFLQKQKIGAELHIYLEEGTYHKRLFRGPNTIEKMF